jgi:predicted HAD superfamily phosphohydrolase YqeG
MDEFLIPHANFKRLYEEFKRHGSISIGLDFDNTIFDYHKKGYTFPVVIDLVKRAQAVGMKIHIFTANESHEFVLQHCNKLGIIHEGINTCGVKLGWESRKPFYSLLLDDRAGLISAVDDLSQLVNVLEIEAIDNLEFDDELHSN